MMKCDLYTLQVYETIGERLQSMGYHFQDSMISKMQALQVLLKIHTYTQQGTSDTNMSHEGELFFPLPSEQNINNITHPYITVQVF